MTPTDNNPNGYPAHAVETLKNLAALTQTVSGIKERVDALPCDKHVEAAHILGERITRIEECKADKTAMNWTTGILTTIGAAVGAIALFISRKVGG